MGMGDFHVAVRNDDTGELRVIQAAGMCELDAQIAALQELFAREGWRKATALLPEAVTPAG